MRFFDYNKCKEVKNMNEIYYTIGEVSKLTNISIKALRYYDKINLFKPAYVDPTTNYRYYKDSQLYHLDFIKSLKYLGIPLEEVKKAQDLKADGLLAFITKQEQLVQKKLNNLLEIQQNIINIKKRMQRQKEVPTLGEVHVLDEEETRIIQTKAKDLEPLDILNASYSKLKKIVESTDGFMNTDYGATFSYQTYKHIEEITYRHIFTPILTNKRIPTLTTDMEITTIPKGKYVRIAYIYSPAHYMDNLQKMMDYINEQQLTVISDVYECFMPIHYSPHQQEAYIIELKVRVA